MYYELFYAQIIEINDITSAAI